MMIFRAMELALIEGGVFVLLFVAEYDAEVHGRMSAGLMNVCLNY